MACDDVILFIDDERDPPPGTTGNVHVVRTLGEAFDHVKWHLGQYGPSFAWSTIYWDHDLGARQYVYPLALYFAKRAFYGQPVRVGCNIIHSSNEVGAENLRMVLGRWSYPVVVRPVWWGTR